MELIAPDPGDRGESEVRSGRVGGSALGEDRRLVRDRLQVLARGALVCPACGLPISPAPRVRPRAQLRCGFCGHAGEAIAFLAEDAIDVPGNDAALTARY